MYRVTTRQETDGTFTTLGVIAAYDDAIESAKSIASHQTDRFTVYVFNEQTIGERVYPYLVAKVIWFAPSKYTNGETVVDKY